MKYELKIRILRFIQILQVEVDFRIVESMH